MSCEVVLIARVEHDRFMGIQRDVGPKEVQVVRFAVRLVVKPLDLVVAPHVDATAANAAIANAIRVPSGPALIKSSVFLPEACSALKASEAG